LYILLDYEMTPGQGGEAPEVWPAQSRIPRHPVVPTLVMLMHPRWSCSRASLQEFSRLLVHFQEHVSAAILYYSPDSVEHDWESSDRCTPHAPSRRPAAYTCLRLRCIRYHGAV